MAGVLLIKTILAAIYDEIYLNVNMSKSIFMGEQSCYNIIYS